MKKTTKKIIKKQPMKQTDKNALIGAIIALIFTIGMWWFFFKLLRIDMLGANFPWWVWIIIWMGVWGMAVAKLNQQSAMENLANIKKP